MSNISNFSLGRIIKAKTPSAEKLRNSLRKFAVLEENNENVDFLIEVDKYRLSQNGSEEQLLYFCKIVKQFIERDVQEELNLSSDTRARLLKIYKEKDIHPFSINSDVFERAYTEIMFNYYMDGFARFSYYKSNVEEKLSEPTLETKEPEQQKSKIKSLIGMFNWKRRKDSEPEITIKKSSSFEPIRRFSSGLSNAFKSLSLERLTSSTKIKNISEKLLASPSPRLIEHFDFDETQQVKINYDTNKNSLVTECPIDVAENDESKKEDSEDIHLLN